MNEIISGMSEEEANQFVELFNGIDWSNAA
jgi:hypothetical protein